MAYASVDQVRSRLPQVKITENSRPSESEVQDFINQVSAELDVALHNISFVVPITAPLSLSIVRDMVVNEVPGKVLNSQFGGIRNPDDLGAINFHAAYLEKFRALMNPNHPFTLPDAEPTNAVLKNEAEMTSLFEGSYAVDDNYRTVTRNQVF